VRKTGPRPPSPTSKVRTIEQRDEEEKKKGRGERAKRRTKGEEEDDGTEEANEVAVAVEKVELGSKGPGEDEDWEEPERPAKRAKVDEKRDRSVRWNKELMIVRGDLGENASSKESSESGDVKLLKSCIPDTAQVSRHLARL
jgi:hypothetical protein